MRILFKHIQSTGLSAYTSKQTTTRFIINTYDMATEHITDTLYDAYIYTANFNIMVINSVHACSLHPIMIIVL